MKGGTASTRIAVRYIKYVVGLFLGVLRLGTVLVLSKLTAVLSRRHESYKIPLFI